MESSTYVRMSRWLGKQVSNIPRCVEFPRKFHFPSSSQLQPNNSSCFHFQCICIYWLSTKQGLGLCKSQNDKMIDINKDRVWIKSSILKLRNCSETTSVWKDVSMCNAMLFATALAYWGKCCSLKNNYEINLVYSYCWPQQTRSFKFQFHTLIYSVTLL